jgi:hypothetical protein
VTIRAKVSTSGSGEPGNSKIMKRNSIEEELRLTTVAIIPQTTGE